MVTKVRQEDGRILCFENLVVENGEILADRIWFEPMMPGGDSAEPVEKTDD